MGLLKPDVEKMEAQDVKRLQRTLKYDEDEDEDVKNKAAEALKRISRGENIETSGKISENEEMKEDERTITSHFIALVAGIGLGLIPAMLIINAIITVPAYFYTSFLFGYLYPKFYKVVGILLVIPGIVFSWVSLFSSTRVDEYFFGMLIISVFLFLVTLLGCYLGSSVRERKKGWIQTLTLIIGFMFILIWLLFRYLASRLW